MRPAECAKAIVAGLIAGLAVLAGAAGDGISSTEWLTAAGALLTGFGAVFQVPNAHRPTPLADDLRGG